MGIAPTYNLRRGVDVAAKINVTHIMPRKANMAADKHPDFHPNLPRIFFSKIGNQTLRTAIWTGTDKGYGKRTPLLFFNGIGANLEIAQAFADTFTGRDIITFDMPGVGGSPDPQIPYRPWWVAYDEGISLSTHGHVRLFHPALYSPYQSQDASDYGR